ncbi:MAG: P-II family nitrogen regulator [Syntrophorhabdales bacterium]|jgi:nitrogen regulatory protein P-II 1
MKKIEAIIQPSDVEGVKEELARIEVRRMIVTEVNGFVPSGGRREVYRGLRYEASFVIEAKVEIVVTNEMVEDAVRVMGEKVKTNESGQSDVRVFPLDETARLTLGTKSAAM